MKILVSNDDGIQAKGLWLLVKALQGVGEVVVVAPDREQSAVSSALTLHHPVRAHSLRPSLTGGVEAFSVEGTPADSVLLALSELYRGSINLVVAGINEGANLGEDVFLSGTVGAALQGYFRGIPSLALSVEQGEHQPFPVAASLGSQLARLVREGQLAEELLLNVNVPSLPKEEIRGIEITKLARRSYLDLIRKGHDGKREYYWIRRGAPQGEVAEDTDIAALQAKKISITPLQTDLTKRKHLSSLQDRTKTLFQDLTRLL